MPSHLDQEFVIALIILSYCQINEVTVLLFLLYTIDKNVIVWLLCLYNVQTVE